MASSSRTLRFAAVVVAPLALAATLARSPLVFAASPPGDPGEGVGEPAVVPPAADLAKASEGTRRMVQRLRQLAHDANVLRSEFFNDRRLERIRAIDPPAGESRRLAHDFALGVELLRAGETAEAVALLRSVRERLDAIPEWRNSPKGREAYSMLAIAHMRLGEQENCIKHHGSDSCLLPIRGDGVHTNQQGSRAAIEVLEQILARDPSDLRSRWLLNVAFMTVGDYPAKVPKSWLIPPSAFESDYDIGRFHDVASAVGLDVLGLAGGAILEDFDGDRHLDLLVTSWGLLDQIRLFRSNRNGSFVERTEEALLTGIVGGLNAVHADYDNDGDMDVFVPRGGWFGADGLLPPSLLRNRGDGTFDDVTEEAGLLASYPSQAAAWGDFDNDGWVDLLVAPESWRGAGNHPVKLYRNNRDGTFTDVAEATGVAVLGFFKGAVWGDYNNDGRLDLYLTGVHNRAANRLFRNDGLDQESGHWKFTDVADEAGVRGPPSSFPTWFFDYDNDGWLDIFVSGYAGSVADVAADYLGVGTRADGTIPRLYRNQGDGTFRDVARELGLDTVVMTMGCNFGDLDNDGWLDFYLGTGNPDYRTLVPNRMFRNAGGKVFQDVTTSGGFGHLQKGHGVAFGDIDNDGDQDVFLKVGGAYTGDVFQSALFENPGHGNNWITLVLVGVQSNRAAIGARIKVEIEEPAGRRVIHRTVTSGSSFGGSPFRQEIGLGLASKIRRLEITWPASGRHQVFEDIAPNQFLEIREDAMAPQPIAIERVELASSASRASEDHAQALPASTTGHHDRHRP